MGGLFSDNMFLDDGRLRFEGGNVYRFKDIIAERRNVGAQFYRWKRSYTRDLTYKIFSKESCSMPVLFKGKEETRTRTSGSLSVLLHFKGSVQSL